jgi:hypothetical protein
MKQDDGYRQTVGINPKTVQQFLGDVDYPITKMELIDQARDNGADEELVDILDLIPQSRFESPIEVSKALGNIEYEV